MKFRKAIPRDRPQLIKIWGNIFGDGEPVSNRLLNDFAGAGNVYVAEENERIISQLLAVPCEAGGQKGVYLYALATTSEYRGQGVMGKLMDHAEEQVRANGGSFFILIPASASLFDYYKAHGFETILMKNMTLDVDCESAGEHNDFISGEIPVGQFLSIRCRYGIKDTVSFDENRTSLELEEQWYYGCGSVYSEEGYTIYLKVEDILFVTEVAAASENLAMDLIKYAKEITACSSVKVTLAQNNPFFFGCKDQAKQTPQAQYKWWGEGMPPEFYVRYVMDDLPARIQANKEDMII